MKIAIIGAGFTGLSAAIDLIKKGHEVVIFERENHPGGIATGYKENDWQWTLEQHYHHLFTNDKYILKLAKEINYEIIIKRPKTSSFINGNIYQLDSPLTLLRFSRLSVIDRFRTAFALGLLRYNPFWKPLEKFKAKPYLQSVMGDTAYKTLWEPLLINKLGEYADSVSLAWFWARIVKRTTSLVYPAGGFLNFAEELVNQIKKSGGKVYFNTEITEISSENKPQIKYRNIENLKLKIENYDIIVVTLPSFLFQKIAPQLPETYKQKMKQLKNIGAVNMILRLKKPFFNDGTYWLNMCDLKSPILAIVEHTNFMDKKFYNNEHLVYVGNYLKTSDPRFTMSPKELLKLYDPWLKKINPTYSQYLINYKVFKTPFAQPIIPINYSKIMPSFKTPLNNVYLANIEQVYPWDRGTNYAVELGEKIAEVVIDN